MLPVSSQLTEFIQRALEAIPQNISASKMLCYTVKVYTLTETVFGFLRLTYASSW